MKSGTRKMLCVLVALVALCAAPAHAFTGGKDKVWKAQEAKAAVAKSGGIGLVGVVNVNTATQSELELLPGIGPTKSKAIVAYRTKKPYKDPRHLLRVKGIGRKTLHRILPFLVVKGATTIKKK